MKYRLNDDVIEFIKTVVNPSDVNWYIRKAEDLAVNHNLIKLIITTSKSGLNLTLNLHRDARFTEVEELKPNIWYPAEKFDGNPNDYWLLELDEDDLLTISTGNIGFLFHDARKFMYIEPTSKE